MQKKNYRSATIKIAKLLRIRSERLQPRSNKHNFILLTFQQRNPQRPMSGLNIKPRTFGSEYIPNFPCSLFKSKVQILYFSVQAKLYKFKFSLITCQLPFHYFVFCISRMIIFLFLSFVNQFSIMFHTLHTSYFEKIQLTGTGNM